MGRTLRGISGQEAVKAFKRFGYSQRKSKGSHVNLVKPGSNRLTIPLHTESSVGLLANKTKKAGLTVEELLELPGRCQMEAMEYTVILHWDEEYGGYWVEVPALPGCVSQGKSKEEALANIKEAIELHLECLKEDGEGIPREESYRIAVATR